MSLPSAKKLLMSGSGSLRSPVEMIITFTQEVKIPRGAKEVRGRVLGAGYDGNRGTATRAGDGGAGGTYAARLAQIPVGEKILNVVVGERTGQPSFVSIGGSGVPFVSSAQPDEFGTPGGNGNNVSSNNTSAGGPGGRGAGPFAGGNGLVPGGGGEGGQGGTGPFRPLDGEPGLRGEVRLTFT